MSTADLGWLPPRPDPATGEPRPPSAPRESHKPPDDDGYDKQPSGLRQPKDGGPLLESYCIPLHDRAKLVGVLMLVVVVLFSLANRGVGWMADWWLWLFVAAPPLLFLTRSRMAAGTDWFRTDNRKVVYVYDLKAVKLAGNPTGFSWVLLLRDSHGGDASTTLHEIQQNPALWDLVYNGLCHSIACGAETNAKLWRHLPLPERLREAVGPSKR